MDQFANTTESFKHLVMDPEESSSFSRMLRDTLAQERTIVDKANHATDSATPLGDANRQTSSSSFQQQMYQVLLGNNAKLPPGSEPPQMENNPQERDIVDLMRSHGVEVSESDAADLRARSIRGKQEGKRAKSAKKDDETELEQYHQFLCQVSALWTVESVPETELQKTAKHPYGSGASMTVYPGQWTVKAKDKSVEKKVVAIKYCNITPPQGASSLRDCKNQISSRLKSVLYELEVMSGQDNRHSDMFPEVYAMSWEECGTPAGITIYQPILIVEPAIATLEEYICNGWPHSVVRHEAEKRFIISLHSAMSYLHGYCGLVHGNMKPGNILVTLNRYSGEVQAKLSDFGLASPIYDLEHRTTRENWYPLGTRYWSAPEMCLQKMSIFCFRINPYVADYYSFGLIVWFILLGYPVNDSAKHITKEDEEKFIAMKGQLGTQIQDLFEEAFKRRWRWKVSDSCVKLLKREKNTRKRKKVISALSKVKQIQEQEWDEQIKKWISTKSQLHHAYRGLVRAALSWNGDERIYPCVLPTSLIFERPVSELLAACHICDELGYPSFDSDFSADAAKRRTRRHLGSELYARQASDEAKQAKAKLMSLQYKAINSIPQSLAQDLLKMLVSRAGNETRSQDERFRDMKSIQNLGTVFQSDVDLHYWERQRLDLGPSVHRLKYVYEQSIINEPLGRNLATAWILDGLSSFITEEVDEKAHSVFTSLRHDLAKRPDQIALTDWMSEIGSRTTSRPRYEDLDKHPIFKSILQGNLPELQHQLTRSKTRPLKLRYKHYNLLTFAIINCQPKICRYLCLEHSFMFTYNESGQEAIEACINDTSAVILSEFDSFSALAHEKRSHSAVDKTDEIPISLNVRLLYPPCLALLAQRGSAMAMELTQSLVSDPLGLLNKLIQQNWVDQFQGVDSVNPLLNSLHTRRLTPFLRLLQTGQPDNALFPPDSVIFGMPILIHAINSLAPFFVAALLAYGADANTSVNMSGFKVSALQMVCMETCLEGYTTSLEQRLEFHEQCGFDDFVIRRDRAEIKSAQQDASSQRILIAELLISYGADINGRPVAERHGQDNATATAIGSETPLSLAIECGDIELACSLTRRGRICQY